jgi:protein-S-isoprenylcysteine O-methyltransferase Ste14
MRHPVPLVTSILAIVGVCLVVSSVNPEIKLGPLGAFTLGRAPAAFGAIAAAIITFFALISRSRRAIESETDPAALRLAIAGTLTVLYVVLVGTFAFWQPDMIDGKPVPIDEVTKLLITSLTATMGTVVAFYFAASAYVQVNSRRDRSAATTSDRNPQSRPEVKPDST